MPLRKTYGFNHMANGLMNSKSNTVGLPGIYAYSGLNLCSVQDGVVDENKWWGCPSSGGSGVITLDVRTLFQSNTTKSILGFRLYATTLAQCRVGSMWNGSNAVIGEVLASTINTGALSTNSIVSNQECYIEIVFDWVNYFMMFRVDGADKYKFQLTQAQMASILTTYPIILIGSYQSSPTFWTKDYYISDGSSSDVPLGPIIVRGGVMQSSNAANFAAAPGQTAKSVLSQKSTFLGGTDLWPNIQSSSAVPGDIASTFAVDYAPASILAVEPWLTARDYNATVRNVTPKITLGGVTNAGSAKALSVAPQFAGFNYPSLLAPDGGAWTPAKVAASTFTHSITS